jgi:hypothetical protein
VLVVTSPIARNFQLVGRPVTAQVAQPRRYSTSLIKMSVPILLRHFALGFS